MDANQLLFYLRGFFELVDDPSPAQIRAVRAEVLRAKAVAPQLIPIETVVSERSRGAVPGCVGCGENSAPRPAPYIDSNKLP